MAIFEVEVDVAIERPPTPQNTRTHYIILSVEDQPSWTRMEIEARNYAAWMCWHKCGPMVTAVRIVGVEE